MVVPFGKRKFYTAIVHHVHSDRPTGYELKEVAAILDRHPVLLPGQLDFWEWLADYYLCTLGDVYKAALPSGMKIESETVIDINPDYEASVPLTDREQKVYDLLTRKPAQSITRLEKASGMRGIMSVINSLLRKKAIYVTEELRKSYRPKTEAHVRLSPAFANERRMHFCLDELQRRAPKQMSLLLKLLELTEHCGQQDGIPKAELLRYAQSTPSVLSGLSDKGIVEIFNREVGRLDNHDEDRPLLPLNTLSPQQQQAFEQIQASFSAHNVCLLHGVTSSGKTEIYIHLIDKALRRGEQVLYLLPEIALTTQITERLRQHFGNRLGIYHSKFPDAERVEVWLRQLSDHPYDVVLGVRSSIFLPFRRLGLVIVDEEHEASYKQQEPAPRYHARNAAIMLAQYSHAKTLLGSATPAIETWHNANTGKYGLVSLSSRYREVQLPHIIPIDIKELRRKKRMDGNFAPTLIAAMREALSQGNQVILFQNRRGFAPMLECHVCGWVPRCPNCDVSLTYHKGFNRMTCHYCGFTTPVPRQCPACESLDLRHRGVGTEKVEDDVKALFPEAKVARMDLDTTRTRTAYEHIISDFQKGRTDILIGTQMVSKGLDFDRVSTVGIIDADTMLNYPDFRAYERAFQLMAQVAGRAGRRERQGTVYLQTRNIGHPLIARVMTNDYEGMAAEQLAERQLFRYPPYHRLIYVYLKNRDEHALELTACAAAERLRSIFGNRVLGPDKPPVARIQMMHIRKIMLKVEVNATMSRVRTLLRQVQQWMAEDERFRSTMIYYDVDPV